MKKEPFFSAEKGMRLLKAGKSAAVLLFDATAKKLSPRPAGQRLIALGEGLETLYHTARQALKDYVENGLFDVEEIPRKPAPKAAQRPVSKPLQKPEKEAAKEAVKEPVKEAPAFPSNSELGLFDAQSNPVLYANLLERQKEGSAQLITRYRRSFESRLIQSKDPMQTYYSGLKNALLRYKNVKSRISFSNENFHQSRNHIAKLIVKTSCLYIYLAVDPEELKGTKYETAIADVSDRKKFGTLPTVIKIKGERKYKYALELIERVCGENLQLPLNKKYSETDYTRPYQTDEELIAAGLIKQLVAGVDAPEDEQ